jgi:peptidoglycan/xylan/chitin deacetylase (PgdA/CDA1 family)
MGPGKAVIGLVGAASVAVGAAGWAVRGRASQVFGPSVWRGPRDGRNIAVTFDDGPSEGTPELLGLLDRLQVRATFFQCGANAGRLPVIASHVSKAGHEIGNHTFSHARLYLRRPGFVRDEVAKAQVVLGEVHGRAPRWFRAPYGCRWFGLRKAQSEFGLTGAMWTVMGSDWRLPPDRISARILRGLRPGAVICLHDGRELQPNPDIGATIAAISLVIPRVRDLGFRFVTMSEMFGSTRPAWI